MKAQVAGIARDKGIVSYYFSAVYLQIKFAKENSSKNYCNNNNSLIYATEESDLGIEQTCIKSDLKTCT